MSIIWSFSTLNVGMCEFIPSDKSCVGLTRDVKVVCVVFLIYGSLTITKSSLACAKLMIINNH